jgi:hypothetical protein
LTRRDVLEAGLVAATATAGAIWIDDAAKSASIDFRVTAAETAAGITPTNRSWPPGDVRRYGAVGNGFTNDTVAVQAAVDASDAVYIDASLVCSINQVNVSTPTRIYGGGTIKVHSQVGNGKTGILNCTAAVTIDGLNVDMNSLGNAGITIGGAGSVVRNVSGINFLGNNIDPDGETRALIIANGSNCEYSNLRGENLLRGTASNESAGRLMSIQGNSVDTKVDRVWVKNVGNILVIGLAAQVQVSNVFGQDIADNGFYLLAGGDEVTIDGFMLYNVPEPCVFSGAKRCVLRNGDILNPTSSIGCSNATDITIENVHTRYDSTYVSAGTAFARMRNDNTTTNGLRIVDCSCDLKQNQVLLGFNVGTLNNLVMRGNRWRMHWHAGSKHKKFMDWTTGDQFCIEDNIFEVIDDTSAMTSRDIFTVTVPTPTKPSRWKRNVLQCRGGQIIRAAAQTAAGTTRAVIEYDDMLWHDTSGRRF